MFFSDISKASSQIVILTHGKKVLRTIKSPYTGDFKK